VGKPLASLKIGQSKRFVCKIVNWDPQKLGQIVLYHARIERLPITYETLGSFASFQLA